MNHKNMIFPLMVVLVIISLFVYGYIQHSQECPICSQIASLNADSIRHYIEGFGSWAIVVYVLLYTANTFSPFFPPIFIMSLSAGAFFGPASGTVALTLGTFCGTTAAFFTARYIGRRWVQRHLQEKGRDVYEKLSQNGFFILLPMRIIGFPPYGIIDFICGLSKMKFSDFTAATLIGAAPWIITQVLLADRFSRFNLKDPVLWILLIVFISMIVITGKLVKKKQTPARNFNPIT